MNNKFTFLKVFCSPFKRPKIKFYFGKIKFGVPIFFPRKWVNFTENDAIKKAEELILKKQHINESFNSIVEKYKKYQKAIPKKISFDFVGLGWKTKWSDTDYRHEWNPIWSFVFFKYQVCIFFEVPHDMSYWESWLYYEYNTNKNKTKQERINDCIKNFSQTYRKFNITTGDTIIDYYPLILKNKYLK